MKFAGAGLVASSAWFESSRKPEIVSLKKIWDEAKHNAFPDLIRFHDKWYCVFREGERHQFGADGKLRMIVSADGDHRQSAAGPNFLRLLDGSLWATSRGYQLRNGQNLA